MQDTQQIAAQALGLMDLTRLEDDTDDTRVRAMCKRTATAFGHPAAVCVYPRFIQAAREALAEIGLADQVAVATVANFPAGKPDPEVAAREIGQAITLGADEVDVVFPWRALLEGDENSGRVLVRKCRLACASHPLKVILESGMLDKPDDVRRAAKIAIAEGADFIKTSTGKAETGATAQAARVMLETIRASGREVGFKVSGGVRTLDDACRYMQLAEEIMGPGWVSPQNFRIGASGLLDALLAELEQDRP
ncbi:MAG: deoxyribose-phosphate aldolase [Wenzhouxiangellaceae bacterium]